MTSVALALSPSCSNWLQQPASRSRLSAFRFNSVAVSEEHNCSILPTEISKLIQIAGTCDNRGCTLRPSGSPLSRGKSFHAGLPSLRLEAGGIPESFPNSMTLQQRKQSNAGLCCGARSAHSSPREECLRSMLSRRQLQGLLGLCDDIQRECGLCFSSSNRRNASFTALASGNAAATSGSSSTKLVPSR